MPAALAALLGVGRGSGQSLRDALAEYLSEQQFLLVLDTCEHLVPAVRALTTDLLAQAPALTVLATSRARLGVEAEHVVAVTPLPLDTVVAGVRSPAVELFLERRTILGLGRSDPHAAILSGSGRWRLLAASVIPS